MQFLFRFCDLKENGMCTTQESTLLTIREVAEVLRCCERHVENLRRRQGLPTIRLGRRVLIRRDDLEAWLREQREVLGKEGNA